MKQIVETLCREYQQQIEHRSASTNVRFPNGQRGRLTLSNAGRTVEYFGKDGTYYASNLDDSQDFFDPKITERNGHWNKKTRQIICVETPVDRKQGFTDSLPIAAEVMKKYKKHQRRLHAQLFQEED